MTTKRLLGSATQEKAEVPPSALFDAFIPSRMMPSYVHTIANTITIGRTARATSGANHYDTSAATRGITGEHFKQTLMSCTTHVVHLFTGVSRRNGFPRELLMRTPSRQFT